MNEKSRLEQIKKDYKTSLLLSDWLSYSIECFFEKHSDETTAELTCVGVAFSIMMATNLCSSCENEDKSIDMEKLNQAKIWFSGCVDQFIKKYLEKLEKEEEND